MYASITAQTAWKRHLDVIWNYSPEKISVDSSMDINLQISPVPGSDHEQQEVNDSMSEEMVVSNKPFDLQRDCNKSPF